MVISDDQRSDTLSYMPNVKSELVDHGITFSNAFVENPLCCPSRVNFLTGQDSHTSGVWTNTLPYGGFQAFTADDQTVAHYPLSFNTRDDRPVIVLGDADSTSPIDIDNLKGGIPTR